MSSINSADKRKQILAAAAQLFARQGFRKTSVDEIAQTARVGKATIYQYFEDKNALLGEVYLQKATELVAKMKENMVPGEPTVQRLLKMLATSRDFCGSDPIYRQFLEHRDLDALESTAQFDAIENAAVSLIEEALNYGIQRGEIRPMPTKMASYILFRVSFYLTHHGQDLFAQFPPDEVVGFVETVLIDFMKRNEPAKDC